MSPNWSMKAGTTSGRIREPDAAANRNDLQLKRFRTSPGRSMMRSNITGTTTRPVAACSSTRARVASGSNLRRLTMVHAISAQKSICE
jgi:hypothetical protein